MSRKGQPVSLKVASQNCQMQEGNGKAGWIVAHFDQMLGMFGLWTRNEKFAQVFESFEKAHQTAMRTCSVVIPNSKKAAKLGLPDGWRENHIARLSTPPL